LAGKSPDENGQGRWKAIEKNSIAE